MHLPKHLELATVLLLTLLLARCGSDNKKPDENDNGGDHVPDGKVYPQDTLPAGSGGGGGATGGSGEEVTAPFLRRFVHTAERDYVCLDHTQFDDAALSSAQTLIAKRVGSPKDYGLEGIVNQVLATVDQFSPGSKPASSRAEIDLVWSDQHRCDVLITRVGATDFPFSNADFKGKTRALLYVNQLRDPAGQQNTIPVGYVDKSVTGADLDFAVQYLAGWFLGLGESALTASNLNSATTSATANHGWLLNADNGALRTDDDVQILYGYALVYRNLLKPADLGTAQLYQDQLFPADAPQDTDLDNVAGAASVPFAVAVGDPYVTGARMVGTDNLTVCFKNVSGVAIAPDRLAAYLTFAAVDKDGGIIKLLHDREAGLAPKVVVADTGCQLLVYLKNQTQYPFANSKVNGLYGHEGTLRTKSGDATTLPVIYLNAATLELDPAAQTSAAKPLTLVLQHEFAHFLGLKHSTSSQSILSPAGYYPGWDLAGGDGTLMDEYVKVWRSKR